MKLFIYNKMFTFIQDILLNLMLNVFLLHNVYVEKKKNTRISQKKMNDRLSNRRSMWKTYTTNQFVVSILFCDVCIHRQRS